jgi:hypothetical protein
VPSRPRQLAFDLRATSRWGGRREGAGRKRGPKSRDPHRRRAALAARFPCHVTLKVRPQIPSLRSVCLVRELELSFAAACNRGRFRLVHYSIQSDHAHLIVEAASSRDLATRHEVDCRAPGARREPRLCPPRCGPRRPLSPPHPPHAARGSPGDRLCAPERAAASREVSTTPAPNGRHRSSILRTLVRRLARPTVLRATWTSTGGDSPHVAALHGLAASWAHRPRGGAGAPHAWEAGRRSASKLATQARANVRVTKRPTPMLENAGALRLPSLDSCLVRAGIGPHDPSRAPS